MTLAEIRQKNRQKSTHPFDILEREMEEFDPAQTSPKLVKSQRALFEEVIRPHSRKMYAKYLQQIK